MFQIQDNYWIRSTWDWLFFIGGDAITGWQNTHSMITTDWFESSPMYQVFQSVANVFHSSRPLKTIPCDVFMLILRCERTYVCCSWASYSWQEKVEFNEAGKIFRVHLMHSINSDTLVCYQLHNLHRTHLDKFSSFRTPKRKRYYTGKFHSTLLFQVNEKSISKHEEPTIHEKYASTHINNLS